MPNSEVGSTTANALISSKVVESPKIVNTGNKRQSQPVNAAVSGVATYRVSKTAKAPHESFSSHLRQSINADNSESGGRPN